MSSIWPEAVRARVRHTYLYFGGSLGITAAAAVAVHRSPMIMNLMSKNSMLVGTMIELVKKRFTGCSNVLGWGTREVFN